MQRAEKILSRINELASISEDETCIARTFGTKEFMEGAHKVLSWMQHAGLEARIDNIGNVRGLHKTHNNAQHQTHSSPLTTHHSPLTTQNPKSETPNSKPKTFVIASHIDTVINAGKFDGPLGVIMGIDLLEQLIKLNVQLPFNIELIAFSDEEGVRFHTTYLGSKVVAGSFDTMLLNKKDAAGITLSEVIESMQKDAALISSDAIEPSSWLGYFEIHIEQGPVLYESNIPVAVVTAIAGQKRVEVTFKGMAGHAGTVPMNMRNDALCCAAEFILETEKLACNNKQLVATVGKLNIINSASNVIPGEVVCSVDIRSADEQVLSSSYEALMALCKNICERRNIHHQWNLIQSTTPVLCNKQLNNLLVQSINDANFDVVELVSGAGHDAVPVSEVAPVSMMFVRCYKGISHNPLEDVEIKDITAAIQVADNFIHHLIKHNQ